MATQKIQGVITALITPFNRDLSVDYGKLKALVEEQVQSGVNGILPMGTSGESPTVSAEEHSNIIRITIEQVAGRIPVFAGTGSNCTQEAIKLTQEAADFGADFTLQVAPYYNKPTQEGFYRHFSEIAEKGNLPVVLYNIPGRSGKNIEPETVLRLANNSRIVGIKEASGSLPQAMEILAGCPADFMLFSGDDNLTLPLIAVGADGVISVAGNLIPSQMVSFTRAALQGDMEAARSQNIYWAPLFKNLFIETNPVPVKTALAMMGKIEAVFRLPLCPMTDEHQAVLKKQLQHYRLI